MAYCETYTSCSFHEKDTVHVVKKYSVFQATLVTDLIQEFVKCPFLFWPAKLKQDYEVTEKYIIPSPRCQPLL